MIAFLLPQWLRSLPLVSFAVENFPSAAQILTLGPTSLALAWAYLRFAGGLKRGRGWKTGYTRKVFHFLVFSTAAAVQVGLGVSALLVFGAATSGVIFYAVYRGEGHVLFEAMARESDAPHRSHFILAPYLATLVGGLTSNALFGGAAICGYLVAGLGDAIGEPVGTRFGRHRYRVPSAGGVTSYRSLEGSAAVFAVSFAALAIAQLLRGGAGGVSPLLFIALAATLIEALSPHGWDNLTLQIVPSALAAWLLRS